MPFLSATLSTTSTTRFDYVQSASSGNMQRLFQEKLSALIEENVGRAVSELPLLNVADVQLAGGGDGQVFVLALLLTTDAVDPGWAAADLPAVRAVFWMGSDDEALGDYQEAALAELKAGADTITGVVGGHAGAGQGTRFMDFIAGIAT